MAIDLEEARNEREKKKGEKTTPRLENEIKQHEIHETYLEEISSL